MLAIQIYEFIEQSIQVSKSCLCTLYVLLYL